PLVLHTSREEAIERLRHARQLLEQGRYAEAAYIARSVQKMSGVRWGLYDDSPDKLLADIEKHITIQNKKTPYEKNTDLTDATPWAEKLFDETRKDFGPCDGGTVLTHRFKITNVYSVPLEIINVRTSAACVTWRAGQTTLPPGGKTYLEVALDTTKFFG